MGWSLALTTKALARGARGFLRSEMASHVTASGHAFHILDGRRLRELLVIRRGMPSAVVGDKIQRAISVCTVANIRCRLLSAGSDIPLKIVRHEILTTVCQQRADRPATIFLQSPSLRPMSMAGTLDFFATDLLCGGDSSMPLMV